MRKLTNTYAKTKRTLFTALDAVHKRSGVDKKIRYLFIAVGVSTGLVLLSEYILISEPVLLFFSLSLVLISLGAVVFLRYFALSTSKVNYQASSSAFVIILFIHLAVGFAASFFYFPNLGPLIKALAFISVVAIVYITLLINNIFLAIEEKGSLIPLYSVAITWVQILIIMISIPFLSGIYKMPTSFLVQNIFVLISSFLLIIYMIWCVSLDNDIKTTALKEKLVVAVVLSFVAFTVGVGTSFIPAESFLRALLISSILMFNLAYVQGHYKNRLTVRMLMEYGVISLVFFVILLIFKP